MGGDEPTRESILIDEPILAQFITTNTRTTSRSSDDDKKSKRTQQRNSTRKRARITDCFQKQSNAYSQEQANNLSRPQSKASRTWLDKARPISCRTCYQNWIYTHYSQLVTRRPGPLIYALSPRTNNPARPLLRQMHTTQPQTSNSASYSMSHSPKGRNDSKPITRYDQW